MYKHGVWITENYSCLASLMVKFAKQERLKEAFEKEEQKSAEFIMKSARKPNNNNNDVKIEL